MNTKSILIKEIENLSEPIISEVLDFVRFLEHKNEINNETYIQSESSLKKEWLSPTEDEAWKNL
jgi:hypothetical protein